MSSTEMMHNTERLQRLMTTSGVKMFGIINKNGRLIERFGRKELDISKEKREILFMQIALQSSMQRDFDEDLGAVSFCMINREKLKFIYRPIGAGNTALVVTSKNSDGDDFSTIDDLCKMHDSQIPPVGDH